MKTSADMLDRMETLVRRMASMNIQYPGYTHKSETGEATVLFAPIADYQEARAIVAELPEPVDPDLATARELVALCGDWMYDEKEIREIIPNIKNGTWDHNSCVKGIALALRRAREEGVW